VQRVGAGPRDRRDVAELRVLGGVVTELTLISSIVSIDGKTLMPSAPIPLRRTLVVRMPSTETSV
jgi:hypothetical protein